MALTATDNLEKLSLEEQGFNGATQKPLTPAALMNVLRENLRRLKHDEQGLTASLTVGGRFTQHHGNRADTSAEACSSCPTVGQKEKSAGSAVGGDLPWASVSSSATRGKRAARASRRNKQDSLFWKAYENKDATEVPPQQHEPPHVLLVEDSMANQLMMTRSIKQNGRSVLGAEPVVTACMNGAEALSELGKQRFDLVFMDLHMPVMGGLLAVKEIRKM